MWWLCLRNRSFLLLLFGKPSKYSVCNMILKVYSHVTSAFAFFFTVQFFQCKLYVWIPSLVATDPIFEFRRWRKRKRKRYVWTRLLKLIERPSNNLSNRIRDSQFIYKRFRWRRVSRFVLGTWRISFTILQSWSTIDAIIMINVQVQNYYLITNTRIIWFPLEIMQSIPRKTPTPPMLD